MPPKFGATNFTGRMGRGGFYKRSNHRHPGRFDPNQDRQASDVPPQQSIHHVMKRDHHQHSEDNQHPQSSDSKFNKVEPDLSNSELDRSDLDKLKQIVEKLTIEIELLKERLRILESVGLHSSSNNQENYRSNNADSKQSDNTAGRQDPTSKKSFFNKKRRPRKQSQSKQQSFTQDQPQASSQQNETAPVQPDSNNSSTNKVSSQRPGTEQGRRNTDRNMNRRRRNNRSEGAPNDRQVIIRPNDDSTTQAADPSSEERLEGDDRTDDGKERKRIYRRKKNRFDRQRGRFPNRRRVDSSERNSNDTSPQAEADANDEMKSSKKSNKGETGDRGPQIDTEEVVQNAKRDFLHSDRPLSSIYDELNTHGSTLIYEFFVSILEHVICDVTSPAELSEISNRIYLMLLKENLSQHQESFVNALNSISNREEDLAIDAPRYMDSLGQFLGENLVLMLPKDEESCKSFLFACLDKYKPENRGNLLASIMTAIAEIKDERFARDLWDKAELKWGTYIPEEGITEFLENNTSIHFTTNECIITEKESTPLDNKSIAQRLEIFADDITAMVERKKDPREILDRWTREVEEFGISDDVAYNGNMIYGIVRGCLVLLDSTCDGVRVDHELLQAYDSILSTQHEKQTEIALFALTLITKLWYQHKCPKDMFINILSALHCSHKTTTNISLRRWLEDRDLHSVPGIGAARLHCKRFIDEVTGSN